MEVYGAQWLDSPQRPHELICRRELTWRRRRRRKIKDGPKAGAVQISQCMVASSKTLDPRSSTLSDRSGLLAAARHAKNPEPRGFRIKYRGPWLRG